VTENKIPELRDSWANVYAQEKDKRYTYADYCSWDDGKRWELIEGTPYAMSAPTPLHQRISKGLFRQIDAFLSGKPCEPFYAPIDVRLNADETDDTVVQPDIIVVCDPSIIDDNSCKGSPDLIIEILSPSSAKHDRIVKFQQYLKAGVREYWIVDPVEKAVQVCVLEGDRYYIEMFSDDGLVPAHALPGLEISLPDVFAER